MTKQVYKITYPTGKIYIGKDSVGNYRYFGPPDIETVNADFLSLPDPKEEITQCESRFSGKAMSPPKKKCQQWKSK